MCHTKQDAVAEIIAAQILLACPTDQFIDWNDRYEEDVAIIRTYTDDYYTALEVCKILWGSWYHYYSKSEFDKAWVDLYDAR